MCGSLRHNDKRIKLGDRLDAREFRTGQSLTGKWSGFMKEAKLDWWKKQAKLKPVEVKADAFVEGRYEFDVPSHTVLGYQLLGDVKFEGKIIGRSGEIKLLTREPMNRFEATIHNRWPVVKVGPNRKLFAFQPWDVKGMLPASQAELPFEETGE